MSKDGFSYESVNEPHAFLQWKGTDACFDFYCKCGTHSHFDGFLAYMVECPHCHTIWEMPFNLFPRETERGEHTVQMLEPDEDFPILPLNEQER